MASAMLFFGVTSHEFRDGFDEDKLAELCKGAPLDERDGGGEPRWVRAVNERINEYGCSVVMHGANRSEVYGLCLNETEMGADGWNYKKVTISEPGFDRAHQLLRAIDCVWGDHEEHPGWVLTVRE